MAVTSARRTPGVAAETEAVGARLALAVADANWYTTENLFGELQRPGVATLLLHCLDYYNAWRRGTFPWQWGRPLERQGPATWRREHVLPSGWMKRFPALGMRPIRRSIADWRARHAPGAKLALVLTYPHYLYLRDQLRPDLHIYFNIDDYSQYWPRCARRVNELERQAVREADLTVCVSRLRAEELRAAVPEAADRVRHLPHGAPSSTLAESPCARPGPPPDDLAGLPGPRLGYVGSLEDRIDWPLLDALATRFPGASVVLIGRLGALRGPWAADARRALSRPNVHALGWRPQGEIARYNRAFDVCLIPYRVDHPFNRVCCPTKIMDSMATGRPVVSTALPECLLYSHLFDVAADSGAFLDAVASILAAGSDDGRAADRHAWARAHSCRRVADQFLDWLPA
jgi:glycosyltransferase involved in cell wall biosynthesis